MTSEEYARRAYELVEQSAEPNELTQFIAARTVRRILDEGREEYEIDENLQRFETFGPRSVLIELIDEACDQIAYAAQLVILAPYCQGNAQRIVAMAINTIMAVELCRIQLEESDVSDE